MLIDTNLVGHIPYEREYEGWIVRGMQDYFEGRGMKFLIFAFSPYYENSFDTDEVGMIPLLKKSIGFQFKAPSSVNADGVSWKLEKDQRDKIAKTTSIFYALPTFSDRKAYKQALHHTLFWHPKRQSEYLGEPISNSKHLDMFKLSQDEDLYKIRRQNSNIEHYVGGHLWNSPTAVTSALTKHANYITVFDHKLTHVSQDLNSTSVAI